MDFTPFGGLWLLLALLMLVAVLALVVLGIVWLVRREMRDNLKKRASG